MVGAHQPLRAGAATLDVRFEPSELTLISFGGVVSGDVPHLIATTLLTGGTNYTCRDNFWSHMGRVRYRVTTGGSPVGGSETGYTDTHTQDAAPVAGTGLTVGIVYQLQFQLDCIPNVPAYAEDWADVTGATWTQPTKENEEEHDFDHIEAG